MTSWVLALLGALGLYLFENNAGTLTLLLCLLLFPLLLLALRRFPRPAKRVPTTEAPAPGESDAAANRAGHDPSETFGIREYRPGDPIRQIHWKLSEKTGKTLLRELGDTMPPPPPEEPPVRMVPVIEAGRPALAPLWAVLLYLSLWGGLCSMAYLSSTGVWVLLPGGLLALALPLMKGKRRTWLIGGTLLLAAALTLLRLGTTLDGAALFLNRLFTASEAVQSYTYEKLPVSAGAGLGALRYALIPAGLLLGLLCGVAGMHRLPAALLFCGYAVLSAWLGVSPRAIWTALLGLALLLPPIWDSKASLPAAGVATAVLLLLGAVLLLTLPAENTALSAWEEGARDRLALHTLAYSDVPMVTAAPEPVTAPAKHREFFRRESAPADTGGEELPLLRRLPLLAAILVLAVLLFLPAILNDRRRKRHAAYLAGVEGEEHPAAVMAWFLHSLRWMRLGGLEPENRPYSRLTGEVAERYGKELAGAYCAALPLWQEAAYSDHPMTTDQRAAMEAFYTQTQAAVWQTLDRRHRFLAKYVYAL